LILYARQLGWFHSTPEKTKQTRAEKIEANGGKPLMPDVEGAEYLLAYWQASGKCNVGAMGPIPLTPADLLAWQHGTRTDLLPWEFSSILEMSRGYVGMISEGEKPETPPPFGDPVREFDRDSVSKKVTNAFKAFIQARKK
jgi:hypothetical protein